MRIVHLAFVIVAAGLMAGAAMGDSLLLNLVADLSGPAIDGVTPTGRAEWRADKNQFSKKELRVEVRNVNLPDGTLVVLDACSVEDLASFRISGGSGRLELRTDSGDFVPVCSRGQPRQDDGFTGSDTVRVKLPGADLGILFGTFRTR